MRQIEYVRLRCPDCGHEADNLAFVYAPSAYVRDPRRCCPSCGVIDKRDAFEEIEPGIWPEPEYAS